jgi:hypothetical protein
VNSLSFLFKQPTNFIINIYVWYSVCKQVVLVCIDVVLFWYLSAFTWTGLWFQCHRQIAWICCTFHGSCEHSSHSVITFGALHQTNIPCLTRQFWGAVTFQSCIRTTSASNFGRATVYSDSVLSWFSPTFPMRISWNNSHLPNHYPQIHKYLPLSLDAV